MNNLLPPFVPAPKLAASTSRPKLFRKLDQAHRHAASAASLSIPREGLSGMSQTTAHRALAATLNGSASAGTLPAPVKFFPPAADAPYAPGESPLAAAAVSKPPPVLAPLEADSWNASRRSASRDATPATLCVANSADKRPADLFVAAADGQTLSSLEVPAQHRVFVHPAAAGEDTGVFSDVLPHVRSAVPPETTKSWMTTEPWPPASPAAGSGDMMPDVMTSGGLDAVPSRGLFFEFVPGANDGALWLPPSVDDATPAVIRFSNADPAHVMEIYWVDYEGQLVLRNMLDPGQSYLESSWASHVWVVRDRDVAEALLVSIGLAAVKSHKFYSAVWTAGPMRRGLSLIVRHGVAHASRLLNCRTRKQLQPTTADTNLAGTQEVLREVLRSKSQPLVPQFTVTMMGQTSVGVTPKSAQSLTRPASTSTKSRNLPHPRLQTPASRGL